MASVVLASASPRRLELLKQLDIVPDVKVADLDETPLEAEAAGAYVERLAAAKAEHIAETCQLADNWVIGADTCIAIDGRILGKPDNYSHACEIWQQLSGRWHEVLSAVAVSHQGQTQVKLCTNRVQFDTFTEAQMQAYWATGEPQDKAGGYAVQGYAAALIQRIEGSYSGIMGLPLFETRQLLLAAGYNTLL